MVYVSYPAHISSYFLLKLRARVLADEFSWDVAYARKI